MPVEFDNEMMNVRDRVERSRIVGAQMMIVWDRLERSRLVGMLFIYNDSIEL